MNELKPLHKILFEKGIKVKYDRLVREGAPIVIMKIGHNIRYFVHPIKFGMWWAARCKRKPIGKVDKNTAAPVVDRCQIKTGADLAARKASIRAHLAAIIDENLLEI